ncbi:Disease resistance domain-containing protein / Tetratricopeptide repeat-containing protein [[Actinomadura] parvosata subsp. kistnae]|nr:Disease resistance domain-containing protein / Tetratricopeptide repeat-containing protein [Actinomadura parvosata subsp. kistnae]
MAIAMAGKWQAGNLPAEPTSLVGRRGELDQIRRACRRSRLVTLTGVGGVGKSRLALRAAAALRPEFGGGAWLVELSPPVDGPLLPHAIAASLRLTDQTARPMVEVLAEHLSGREVLLVLDACEHLTGACSRMVITLLEAVPGLRVLATSRRPLEVPGELVYLVDPLPVPAAGAAGPACGDAVALLAERAAEAVPGFDLADQDQEAVSRLCRRLEGIPLAIELAGARLRELSVPELADRLDDRFSAPDGDPEGVSGPPWHQALRTAIGWSHELCEPAERLLWARLSVFAGDFDAEAVREVCADERLPEADIGLLLDALAGGSILTWLPTGAGERYRMLDTLREYGADRLRHLGEAERFRRRHRDHFLSLAVRGAAGWLGPGQISWYDRMIGEHDNLRAALEVSLAAKDRLPALRLAGLLAFFWYGCGYAKEGRHYLQQALDLDTRPGPELVQALWADGHLAATQGDAGAAEIRAAQIELAAEPGDPYAASCAGALRAMAGVIRGNLVQAMAESETAYQSRFDDEPLTIAKLTGLYCRAHALTADGRIDEAVAVLEDARALCERCGELSMRSHGDFLRGQAELSAGRLDLAVAYGQAALRTKRRLHDSFGMGRTVDLLALAAGAAGRAHRAARLLGLAQRIWSTHGQAQAGVPALVTARRTCEKQARDLLGDNAYEVAFRTGFDSDIDAGINYALEPEGEGLHNGLG